MEFPDISADSNEALVSALFLRGLHRTRYDNKNSAYSVRENTSFAVTAHPFDILLRLADQFSDMIFSCDNRAVCRYKWFSYLQILLNVE